MKSIANDSLFTERHLFVNIFIFALICLSNYIFLWISVSGPVICLLQCYNVLLGFIIFMKSILAIGYKRYKKNEDLF